MPLEVFTLRTCSGLCDRPPLDPGGCENHPIPLGDAVRAAHYTLDRYFKHTLREEEDFVVRDEATIVEALAECLEDTNMYQHLIMDQEAPQLAATRKSKYAFARKILRSPVTQAINLFTCVSPPRANHSLLEPDSDTKQIGVTEKDPSCDSDWCLVPSTASLRKAHSKPVDLSGTVVADGNTSTHGGSYGDVWMGTWNNGKKNTMVAVKAIRLRGDLEDYRLKLHKRLRRELRVWQGLSHPNIVPLLGTVTSFSSHLSYKSVSPAMISPWMKNGNLIRYMESKYLTVSERLHLLLDVVSGIEYLHSQSGGIIHGDLTGANILIDDQGKALLVDFGLSSIKVQFEGTSYWSSTAGGAIRWRAPELLPRWPVEEDSDLDSFVPDLRVACDIFSFGCVMLHTISGKLPYFNIPSHCESVVVMCLSSGQRPRRPDEPLLTDAYWGLVNWCWGKSACARPTAKEVRLRVSRLL
ncbi:kinase-like protein [Athelia psychrophila]|uniref:Kinase-like protein n=1 Tax=Athelia psychrophila TaxID=1759441 RepID=A0A166K815_9AGAM|nr:kinase-like protein [Fibularhizoctonia sp. CBS 109695]KZP21626.1 kinase-like protein [Fibularhizoctonia sp. CBS 109695]